MLQADFLSLFRGQGGRLGFTIERDGFVSDVLDYAAILMDYNLDVELYRSVCMSVSLFLFVSLLLDLHSSKVAYTYLYRLYTI